MKKIFYSLLLALCFLPFYVKADEATITLTCASDELEQGENFACAVNLSSPQVVTRVSATIVFDPDDAVEYGTTATNGLTGSVLVLTADLPEGLSETVPITTIYLKIKDTAEMSTGSTPNVTITLDEIEIETGTPATFGIADVSDAVRVMSNNNSLATLVVGGTNIPITVETSYSHTLGTDVSSVTVVTTKGHPEQVVTMKFKGSTVSGTTVSGLEYGNNAVTIEVDPEVGTKKTYTLTINRPDGRSTINTLSALTIESPSKNYPITFASETTSYTVNVSGEVSAVTINATKTDTKAKFSTGFGPGIKSIDYGKNTFLLKVESEKGTVKTYTIVINRADNRSTNTYLKSLELSNGSLTFDKEVLTYTLTVPYTVTNITVAQEAEDTKSTVTITGGKDLVVGENLITVKVTAENGMTAEYKITVMRQAEEAPLPSSNKYLSKLTVDGYEFDFSKTLYSYTLTINSKDKSLSITTSTEDSKASYRILNNENLVDGSQVKIRVTAEDGTTQDYILNIKVKNTLDLTLLIAIGVLGLGIIVLVIVLIIKGRGNKKHPDKGMITSSTVINRENYNANTNNANFNYQKEEIQLLDDKDNQVSTDQKITFSSRNNQ